MSASVRLTTALATAGIAALGAVTVSAQFPPPREMNAYVLVDVGPVPVPTACPCITNPFTVPKAEIGAGDSTGPGGPRPFGPPSAEDIERNERQKAEDLAGYARTRQDALAGSDASSFGLAMLFMIGHSVARDDVQAAYWFHMAARQGHQNAPLQLGHRYHRGLGVAQSDERAAYWFDVGARRGDRLAMVALGLLHAAGRGVTGDWNLAVAWWEQAAAGGTTPLASRMLGDAYVCGLGVRQDHRRAEQAYKTATAAGEMTASVQLGHLYARGCVAPEKDDDAHQAFRKAADQGDFEAQIALSELYFEGRGVEQDAIQSFFWATLARLRAPEGTLRDQAAARADLAARYLSPFLIEDTERFAKGVIEASRSRQP